MGWIRWAAINTVVVSAFLVPASASASVLAPPGHAGAQQYFETIPTSSGSAAPPGSVAGSAINQPRSKALAHLGDGAVGATRLGKLGAEGRAAAALASQTAPPPAGGLIPSQAKPSALGRSTSNGSLGSGLAHVLTGSDTGGLGLALPLLLVSGLLAALGLAVARLRSRGGSVEPHV